MTLYVAFIPALTLLLLFLSVPKIEGQRVPSCLNNQCHSNLLENKFVHGPVAAGACTMCHKPMDEDQKYDARKHKFEWQAQGADMCYACHERKNTKKVVHLPIAQGLCTLCHDPHGSPNRFQLRKQPVSELCYMCHPRNKDNQKEVHGPVAVGDCVSCHDPHESPYRGRLVKEGNALCFMCHMEMEQLMGSKKFTHVPARQHCSFCHDPHTSPFEKRLRKDIPELCFICHANQQQHINKVKVEHDAYKIDKKCLNCHNPHATDFPKQLKAAPGDLCLSCHNRVLSTPSGKIVNMKALLARNKVRHGPVRQKDCPACHNPHGTDNFRILRKYYPPEFYAPFALDNYKLCFSCHEGTLVLDAQTETLTGFRNGDVNLHYKHVNKPEKGRTCRACHETHASNKPKMIRDTVPFGKWALPTNFEKTETGGKCAPGCHVPRGYDRVEPIKNR